MSYTHLPALLNHPTKILGIEVAHFFILASFFSPIQFVTDDSLATGIVMIIAVVFFLINDNILPHKYFALLRKKKKLIECAYYIQKVNKSASN